MIKQYTEQEFTNEVVRRCDPFDGEHRINLEQLRELCFDVRLTDEQYKRVMRYVRQGDSFLEQADENGGVQNFEDGWRYNGTN